MVITDPLTGCRNRRFFEEIIGRELQRHRRYGIPMSLLFVDIDRFKAINDTLGHDAGDRVLRAGRGVPAEQHPRSRLRVPVGRRRVPDAALVRRGGGAQPWRRPADRLSPAHPTAASLPAGVGLSIGCAEVREDSEDVMALIKVADERMYENKRAQRRNGPTTPPVRVGRTRSARL